LCGNSGSHVPLAALNFHLNAPPSAIPLESYREHVEARLGLLKLLKGLKKLSLREIVINDELIKALTAPHQLRRNWERRPMSLTLRIASDLVGECRFAEGDQRGNESVAVEVADGVTCHVGFRGFPRRERASESMCGQRNGVTGPFVRRSAESVSDRSYNRCRRERRWSSRGRHYWPTLTKVWRSLCEVRDLRLYFIVSSKTPCPQLIFLLESSRGCRALLHVTAVRPFHCDPSVCLLSPHVNIVSRSTIYIILSSR